MKKSTVQMPHTLTHSDDSSSGQIMVVMQPLLLTIEQVAKVLSMSRSKVYELIASEDLPVLRFGKSVRVSVSALHMWIDRQEQQSAPARLERVV